MGECLSPADPDGLVQRSGRQLKSITLRWESRLVPYIGTNELRDIDGERQCPKWNRSILVDVRVLDQRSQWQPGREDSGVIGQIPNPAVHDGTKVFSWRAGPTVLHGSRTRERR